MCRIYSAYCIRVCIYDFDCNSFSFSRNFLQLSYLHFYTHIYRERTFFLSIPFAFCMSTFYTLCEGGKKGTLEGTFFQSGDLGIGSLPQYGNPFFIIPHSCVRIMEVLLLRKKRERNPDQDCRLNVFHIRYNAGSR